MAAHPMLILVAGFLAGLIIGSNGGSLVVSILASGNVYRRAREISTQFAERRARSFRVNRAHRIVPMRLLRRWE